MTGEYLKAASPFAESGDGHKVLGRRSHVEITIDILKAVLEGAEAPTRIMYKANLSWIMLQEHLTVALESELLRETQTGSRKKYELTEKGMNLLRSYIKVVEDIQAVVP